MCPDGAAVEVNLIGAHLALYESGPVACSNDGEFEIVQQVPENREQAYVIAPHFSPGNVLCDSIPDFFCIRGQAVDYDVTCSP